MPSRPSQVFLTAEQDQTLFEMRTATTVPQRTKDRAEVLRLSHRCWKIAQIAEHFSWSLGAVRQAIHRWKKQGLGGLWDAPRQGRSRRWQEANFAYLEELLAIDPRTYSSQQLAEQLSQERHVKLSHYQVQRILKKRVPLKTDSPKSSPVTKSGRLCPQTGGFRHPQASSFRRTHEA